jgi:hypothetical protein
MDQRRLRLDSDCLVLPADIPTRHTLPETMGTETVSCEECPGSGTTSLTRI